MGQLTYFTHAHFGHQESSRSGHKIRRVALLYILWHSRRLPVFEGASYFHFDYTILFVLLVRFEVTGAFQFMICSIPKIISDQVSAS